MELFLQLLLPRFTVRTRTARKGDVLVLNVNRRLIFPFFTIITFLLLPVPFAAALSPLHCKGVGLLWQIYPVFLMDDSCLPAARTPTRPPVRPLVSRDQALWDLVWDRFTPRAFGRRFNFLLLDPCFICLVFSLHFFLVAFSALSGCCLFRVLVVDLCGGSWLNYLN